MAFKPERKYDLFRIGGRQSGYDIQQVSPDSIFKGDQSYRKAVAYNYKINEQETVFRDPAFEVRIDHQSKQKYALRRIYQIYDYEPYFLSQELMRDVPLKPQPFYPTFLSEFSMIDKEYLNTTFFTKRLNSQGLYKYFVRRNGEYYVEYMDDWIPVDPVTKLPPWGLNQKEPWKIILMKAWLKEKGSIRGILNAEPYEFIEAFGFPGYRAISIAKEIKHIAASRISEEVKKKKEERLMMDNPAYIVVGKTRSNSKIQQLGLVPNRAGYRIIKPEQQKNKSVINSNVRGSRLSETNGKGLEEDNIYKVCSELPSYWMGEYSIFVNGRVQDPKINKLTSEIQIIEKEFLLSYFEISKIFSKFYICPKYTSDKLYGNLLQDSISVSVGVENSSKPFYFFQLKVKSPGFLNLNIDLPLDSVEMKPDPTKPEGKKQLKRYSYIKYWMAKQDENEDVPALKGFDFYDGEYMKGYHKSVNRFLELEKGTYYIYFKVEPNKQLRPNHMLAININSTAHIESFKRVDPYRPEVRFQFIMKCALFRYSRKYGLKSYVYKKGEEQKKTLGVYILRGLDQIGFGVISIEVKPGQPNFLAMNIFQEELEKNNLQLCKQAHRVQEPDQMRTEEGPINLAAKSGEAKVVIIERTKKSRQQNEEFPPRESVQFFEIL